MQYIHGKLILNMVALQPDRIGPSFITLLAAGMLACTPSWAARPLVTEDAGVTAKSACELESFAGRQLHPDITLASSQVACGLGWQTQLALGLSREIGGGERSRYVTLGGKTAIGRADDAGPAFALAYTLHSGREQSDYMKFVGAEIKGAVSLPYQGWMLHANAGLMHLHQERERRVLWAVAAERPAVTGNLDLMAEIYGDNRDSPWLQFGARWSAVPDRLVLDASYGIQANGRHTRLATLGMTLAF